MSDVRLWYAVRAVPRAALTGCLALAAAMVVTVRLWEDAAGMLLPMALAATAAASGFVFDDPALAVTAVTPRAERWARVTRLLVATVPLVAWGVLVLAVPDAVVLDRTRWWLAGAGAASLAAGSGALAASRLPRPGGAVASGIALLAVLPLLVGPFLGWTPVFPLGRFPDDVLTVWVFVALLGGLLCALALSRSMARPSPVHRARAGFG